MMTPETIRQTLRTALIYSFMAHGHPQGEACQLAEIAMEPCAQTMELCAKIIQLNLESAAISLNLAAQKAKPP